MMSTRTGVRALVMVTLCYGALEIVGLLLLLLLLNNSLSLTLNFKILEFLSKTTCLLARNQLGPDASI